MQGSRRQYESPLVRDYGDLEGITASLHPQVGAAGTDLSFSMPRPYEPGGGDQPYAGGSGGSGGVGGVGSGGAGGGGNAGGAGGTGGGGGGGGGGKLPFTGLAVGAIAAAGSGLTAAGTALRRYLRRRDDA